MPLACALPRQRLCVRVADLDNFGRLAVGMALLQSILLSRELLCVVDLVMPHS